MAYLTDTNNKILVFVNRAQTKIAAVSVLLADRISEDSRFETYRDEVELAYGLLSFIRSLDNMFNVWTEPEIIKYIDKWTAKANLNGLPYMDHSAFFNNRIIFTGGGSVIPTPPSSSWIMATGFWNDSGVWDDTAVWVD